MLALVAPTTSTAAPGLDPPAQPQQNQQEIKAVNVLEDVKESVSLQNGINVLVVQSTDSPVMTTDSSQALLTPDAGAKAHAMPDLVSVSTRELRGWLMVLATVIASITYASGLSPPGGFEKVPEQIVQVPSPPPPPPSLIPPYISDPTIPPTTYGEQMIPLLFIVSPTRCRIFYYSNTAAFALSLSIILLLASQDLLRLAKIKALEILVALNVMALLVAYVAAASFGSVQLLVCVGLVLAVPVALVVMSSRLCGNYFWDGL